MRRMDDVGVVQEVALSRQGLAVYTLPLPGFRRGVLVLPADFTLRDVEFVQRVVGLVGDSRKLGAGGRASARRG